jgi:hypothetical protein
MLNRVNQPLILCAFAALSVSGAAHAANWEILPRLQGGYRYDDNYRLNQPGNEIEVSGAEADATLLFRNIDPKTKIEIAPRVRATYFPDEQDEDSTDYFLRGTLQDQTPRRSIGVDVNFAHEDVVRTEFSTEPQAPLGTPDVASTTVFLRNQRDLYQARPFFSYDFSQRNSLETQAQYTNAKFENHYNGAQSDFSQTDVSAGWKYQASERYSYTIRALAAHYVTVDSANAFGADAEWGAQISERSRMYVRVGGQNTKLENRGAEISWLGGVGGEWISERNHLFLDLTHSVNAVSAGTVVERTELRFRLNHDISERIAMLLGLSGYHDASIDGAAAYPGRDYVTGQAGLEWRMQRALALTATYTYRWQNDDRFPSDVSANGFLIGVVYQPKRDY